MNRYLYETHVHTSEGSACAHATGARMARAYAAGGYTGMIVSDHFYYGNTTVDRNLPWEDWVEQFCLGYEHARAEGEKLGLQVFFAWESTYQGNDFLVYGLDKEWLLAHPEIRDASIAEQYALVRADGGMVIHAHPYRQASYIEKVRLFPEYVDGVESINVSNADTKIHCLGHPEYNRMAEDYAREYHLPVTSGSDQHLTCMLYGGMVFSRKLTDIHDFIQAVQNREAVALLNGGDDRQDALSRAVPVMVDL